MSDGFFVFNEIYFDTIDKSIVIEADKKPTLILDKNIFYSYLKDFGTSFLYKDPSAVTPFQVKISNSIIEVPNQGYKIFDINPILIGHDSEGNFSFVNCALRNSRLLNPLDVSLTQRVRSRRSDALLAAGRFASNNRWIPVGAIVASDARSLLRIDLSEDCSIELDVFFCKGERPRIKSRLMENSESVSFQMGYSVVGSYCVLLLKPVNGKISPVVSDILGTGLFMPVPSKEICYSLDAYGIKEESEIVLLLEK